MTTFKAVVSFYHKNRRYIRAHAAFKCLFIIYINYAIMRLRRKQKTTDQVLNKIKT